MLSPKLFILLVFYLQIEPGTTSLYADSPFVDEFHPHELYEITRDQAEGMFLIQFYNATDADHEYFVNNYSIAAKSMLGYIKCAAINVDKHVFTEVVMKISKTPTYIYYGFYKHVPEMRTTLVTVDDLHEETTKLLVNFFQERSVYRFIYDRNNMEMSNGDLQYRMTKSKDPWFVIFYKRDHPKCMELAEIWTKLVAMFNERIHFGSVNNPLYNSLPINDEEYPVIKFFPKGNKKEKEPETYIGELTLEDISEYLDEHLMAKFNRPKKITGPNVVAPCLKKKFCIFVFLPDTMDMKDSVNLFKEECKKHGRRGWAWFWNEYREQPEIEDVFGISEEAAPNGTIVVVNVQGAVYMKVSLMEEIDAGILEMVVDNIREDMDFVHNIYNREMPDVRLILEDSEIHRDEL